MKYQHIQLTTPSDNKILLKYTNIGKAVGSGARTSHGNWYTHIYNDNNEEIAIVKESPQEIARHIDNCIAFSQ